MFLRLFLRWSHVFMRLFRSHLQARNDPFRLIRYDVSSASSGQGRAQALLLRRHNAVPGMFLVSRTHCRLRQEGHPPPGKFARQTRSQAGGGWLMETWEWDWFYRERAGTELVARSGSKKKTSQNLRIASNILPDGTFNRTFSDSLKKRKPNESAVWNWFMIQYDTQIQEWRSARSSLSWFKLVQVAAIEIEMRKSH